MQNLNQTVDPVNTAEPQPGWTAGNTGCLEDGVHTRNGKEPLLTSALVDAIEPSFQA